MGETASYKVFVDWNNDSDFDDPGENLSADFVSARTTRAFSGPMARMARMGTATIVLNNLDKQYSPSYQAKVRPGRRVKLEMTYNGTTKALFRGRIEVIVPTAGPYGQRQVTFECVDEMGRIEGVEHHLPLETEVTADEIIEDILTYLGFMGISLDDGINVFATSADRWSHDPVGVWSGGDPTYLEMSSVSAKILDAVTGDWGRFFFKGDGTPAFRNRHHEGETTTSVLVMNAPNNTGPMELSYRLSRTPIYNDIEVKTHPRQFATSLEVLWEMETAQPPKIDPSKTLTRECKYADPDNSAVTIGGKDAVTPVAQTDYTATSDEVGDGDDKTAQVGMVATFYGDRAKLELTNNDSDAIYVQTLRVRGKPIRVYTPWIAKAVNTASASAYGRRRLRVSASFMSSAHQGDRLAEYLLARYKDPLDEVKGIQFAANKSSTLMEAARDLELLDRIEVADLQLKLDPVVGFVSELTHEVGGPPGTGHWVTMNIETAYNAGTPFRLETAPPGGGSALNSGHVLWY